VAGLKINISVIAKLAKNSPETEIVNDYLKRLPWSININQLELKNSLPADKQKIQEGEILLKSIPAGSFVIALDEKGNKFTSQSFTAYLEKISQPICFIIGGAFGLSEAVKTRADALLSLSDMTMPHIIARVILVEQLYRAYSISNNHPYHK